MSPPAGLAAELRALGGPWLIAFDVDGTLAPIVTDPAAAAVPPSTRAALIALSTCPDVTVAFLTGRDAPALERMLSMPQAWRAVDHGLVILAPHEEETLPLSPMEKDVLESFALFVDELGARTERKERSVGAHVRGMENGVALLDAARHEALRRGLQVREGRSVIEASFGHGDKAVALEHIAVSTSAKTLFFAGDDVTDLGAIHLAETRGIGVLVVSEDGPRPDPQVRTVDGCEAVADFVHACVEEFM